VPLPSELRNRVDFVLKLHAKAAALRAVMIAVGADIPHHYMCTMVHYSSHKVMT